MKVLTALWVMAALVVGLVMPATVGAVVDPLSCTGYGQARQFWEGQSWWDQGDGTGVQHIHMGECFPANATVSGILPLDIRLIRHGSLGKSADFRIHDDTGKECYRTNPQVPDGIAVTAWMHIDLNTACLRDGIRSVVMSWRITQPNGNRFIVRQSLILNVQNNTTTDLNWNPNYDLGGAWYKEANPARDWGYSHGLVLNASSFNDDVAHSGTIVLRVAGLRHPRSSVPTEKSFTATMDPAFHDTPPNPGTVLLTAPGGFNGSLSIDTTRFSNGLHRLVLIECIEVKPENKMSCGVNNIPLLIAN